MKFNKIKSGKKVLAVLFVTGLLSLFSCDDDFGDINNNYVAKQQDATIPGLYNGLVASLQKTETRNRVPVAWLYHWTQQAAMFSASGFRLDDKTTKAWQDYYNDLANYRDIENLISAEENPGDFVNIQAMTKTIMAYKALTTTLLYGDIPFVEAGKGFLSTEHFRPAYDSQQSVMETALNDLTWALDNFSNGATQVSLGSAENLLNNDIEMWKKLANSLRLRYAMVMREKNASFADPLIATSLTLPLLGPSELVSLDPAKITGLENDRRGFFRGNTYIRMGSTMWDSMSETDAVDGSGIYDLRCNIFFEANIDDEWVPYPQNPDGSTATVTGEPNHFNRLDDWDSGRSNFASINLYYAVDTKIPQFIITGSHVSFLLAEIYNRGLAGVAADPAMAEAHYVDGITASVEFWYAYANGSAVWEVNRPAAAAPSATELDGMLNHANVAYNADPATALDQIYEQSWIAMFHQPFEAWNLQRRTNNGTPNEPLSATSLVLDFNRLTYPPSERETNRDNWMGATNGNDSEKTKIWIQQ